MYLIYHKMSLSFRWSAKYLRLLNNSITIAILRKFSICNLFVIKVLYSIGMVLHKLSLEEHVIENNFRGL